MKPCQKCHVPKDEEEYSWRFKALSKRDAIRKECRKEYNAEYFNGPARERHLQQVRERKQAAREFAREYVLSYLTSHPCESCGESDIRVLEFHHVGDKETTISKMVGEGFSVERIQRKQGLIFTTSTGKPVSPRNFIRHFKETIKVAGLPDLNVHGLRHSHASLLLASGTNPKLVQERLEHASITLTLQTYSHTIPSLGKQVADKLDEIMG